MDRNGGYIGAPPNVWSNTNRTGVWTIDQQYREVIRQTWPLTITYNDIGQLIWNETNDTYTTQDGDNLVIHIQSRMRRCLIDNYGIVFKYLDADDSTKYAGDWLRIVETQRINNPYYGSMVESPNFLLRYNVPYWVAGVYTKGQRVIYNNQLWECIATSTSATPAAGSGAADLSGATYQVVVEVPAFSFKRTYSSGVHTFQVKLGITSDNGFTPHKAFLRSNGTYRDFFYVGAYSISSNNRSASGATPTVNQGRATLRSSVVGRGSGWHLMSIYELGALQILFITEFQSVNSQKVLGWGSQAGGNYAVSTGLSNSMGNKSQEVNTTGGSANDYVSYRGIENLYGRILHFIDGIGSDSKPANQSVTVPFYKQGVTYANWTDAAGGGSAISVVGTAGFMTSFSTSETDFFIPGLQSTSAGSSIAFTGDYANGGNASYFSSGYCQLIHGGSSGTGDNGYNGLFYYYSQYTSDVPANIGGRVAFGLP